jgi:hypothetical protein
MLAHDTMKRFQILHPHVEPKQIQRHDFGQREFLLPTSFVLPGVPQLLAKGSMKKSLKKSSTKVKRKVSSLVLIDNLLRYGVLSNTFYYILRRL